MTSNEFPYHNFQSHPAWGAVDRAIEKLVDNSDLIEQTHRRYIVGYIVKELSENGLLKSESKVLPE